MIGKTTFSIEHYNYSFMPFRGDVNKLINGSSNYKQSEQNLRGTKNLMLMDFNTWLKNDLLLKVDKMTMAHA